MKASSTLRRLVSSGTVPPNRKRDYFVSREAADAVLKACPDAEWRFIVAMARFGGLRCPSEIRVLRWEDFAEDRFLVHSSKTEHHPGVASRWVPIFPELKPYVENLRAAAEPGTSYCVTRYRAAYHNLNPQLRRIVARAGLKPCPKIWQIMRATRETELAETLPAHVVTAWIGNSIQMAQRHYLQVTDGNFALAAASNALQNPVH